MLHGQTVEQGLIALLQALQVDELVDGKSEAAQMEQSPLQLHIDALHHRRQKAAQTQAIPLRGSERGTCKPAHIVSLQL